MKIHLCSLLMSIASGLGSTALAESALPEPGPQSGGLQMRLIVRPRAAAVKEGYDVRLEILNVTNRIIILSADWQNEVQKGDLADYIEAATSIESYPPIEPWSGDVPQGTRSPLQPQHVLLAGDVLARSWHTDGRKLKNSVTNPLTVQNPELSTPGLYSIHATLLLNTSDGLLFLRSNEQLVSVGRSRLMPKHTFGKVTAAESTTRTAELNLGALHGIAIGDRFLIQSGGSKTDRWRLTISEVSSEASHGPVEPETFPSVALRSSPGFPIPNNVASFIFQK